jgi:hypothetical protein
MTWRTTMNKAEREALMRLFLRDRHTDASVPTWRQYLKFRRRTCYDSCLGCWCVVSNFMLIGIEPDGHTHT